LTLGRLLNKGGAGSIHAVNEVAEQVAKIYHSDQDLSLYERKVQAMLRLDPELAALIHEGRSSSQLAWPTALLRDSQARFRGFLMPKLDLEGTIELEYMLHERQARDRGLPLGLGARVTLAVNLSAVLAELHRQRHYMVDLKPINVRFHKRALYVALLDCDGFSVQGNDERFAALQYTPDYLAPELHGRNIAEEHEAQQDYFALAVIIFRLLNGGVHPFTGRPLHDRVPTDISSRVALRCYPYGLRNHPDILPSGASQHELMPPGLRTLFDRAFVGDAASRPTSADWREALKPFAVRAHGRLLVCSRDGEHQHFAGLACPACARERLLAQTRAATCQTKRSTGARKRKHAPHIRTSAKPQASLSFAPNTQTLVRTQHYSLTLTWPARNWPVRRLARMPTPAPAPAPAPASTTRYRTFAVLTLLLVLGTYAALAAWFSWPTEAPTSPSTAVPSIPSTSAPARAGSAPAVEGLSEAAARRLEAALRVREAAEPLEEATRLTIGAALAAAARGDKAEYERQLELLPKPKFNQDSLEINISYGTAAISITRAAAGASLYAARDACLRAIRAAPRASYAWYLLALSCLEEPDTACSVGAFAVAAALRTEDDVPTESLEWIALVDSHPGRLERLHVLQARGELLATSLGGPAYTTETQALAETRLPTDQ
jgi:hypothetical protein